MLILILSVDYLVIWYTVTTVNMSLLSKHRGQQPFARYRSESHTSQTSFMYEKCACFPFDIKSWTTTQIYASEKHFDAVMPAKQSVYRVRSKGDSYQRSTPSAIHKRL